MSTGAHLTTAISRGGSPVLTFLTSSLAAPPHGKHIVGEGQTYKRRKSMAFIRKATPSSSLGLHLVIRADRPGLSGTASEYRWSTVLARGHNAVTQDGETMRGGIFRSQE